MLQPFLTLLWDNKISYRWGFPVSLTVLRFPEDLPAYCANFYITGPILCLGERSYFYAHSKRTSLTTSPRLAKGFILKVQVSLQLQFTCCLSSYFFIFCLPYYSHLKQLMAPINVVFEERSCFYCLTNFFFLCTSPPSLNILWLGLPLSHLGVTLWPSLSGVLVFICQACFAQLFTIYLMVTQYVICCFTDNIDSFWQKTTNGDHIWLLSFNLILILCFYLLIPQGLYGILTLLSLILIYILFLQEMHFKLSNSFDFFQLNHSHTSLHLQKNILDKRGGMSYSMGTGQISPLHNVIFMLQILTSIFLQCFFPQISTLNHIYLIVEEYIKFDLLLYNRLSSSCFKTNPIGYCSPIQGFL